MATPITLMTLPGGDRLHKIELNAGVTPYTTRSWEADVIDEDIRHSNLDGGVTVIEKVKRKTLLLKDMIVSRATRRLLEELRDSREQLCVSPPWVDCAAPLTYIPLQKTLSDLRHEATRDALEFARLSSRFNSVTGRKTLFGEPHYEDAPRGQGIHISDVVSGTEDTPPVQHFFSPELRSYLTTDAADSGATTIIFVTPAQAVLWDNYGTAVWPAGNKAYLMISNEEETPNTYGFALISAINTGTGAITLTTTDGTAVLPGTADYTLDKRTYISSVLLSDCELSDSGTGSFIDHNTPSLLEKTTTMQETGTQAIRCIGGADDDGFEWDDGNTNYLGYLPNGVNVVLLIRMKVIRGSVEIRLYQETDNASILWEDSSSRSWTWVRFCGEVPIGGGAGQKQIRLWFRQIGATEAEWLIDRIHIFQGIDNGGMEGVYVNEGAGAPGVAPGWAKQAVEAGDNVAESADQHGGAKAQQIDVDAAGEGIGSDANVMADGPWYLYGAYFKVATGKAQLTLGDAGAVVDNIDDATYTFHSAIVKSAAAQKAYVMASGGAADFLVDDIMVIRLPGNPHDDAYYDFAEPVETTGFTAVILYEPEVANTALNVDAFLSEISRRTWDNNAHISVYYDESTNMFRMDIDDGATTQISVAETFAAGDGVIVAVRCDDTGAAGDVDIWAKVNTDTTVTAVNAGADILGGLTRMWIGRTANDYSKPARGSVSCILFVNEVLTDAQVESILDIFSGVDAPELALLEETHGILYEINRDGVRVRGPAKGDEFRLDILLTEVGRVGAFATKDVA